jgi:ribonuclease P protein component
VLSAAHRLRTSDDIRTTIRRGRRAGSRTVLAHGRLGARSSGDPSRIAFVVGKQVGNAVTRNTVKRRLRALMSTRLGLLPDGSDVVLRALPPSARRSSPELAHDLDLVLDRLNQSRTSS